MSSQAPSSSNPQAPTGAGRPVTRSISRAQRAAENSNSNGNANAATSCIHLIVNPDSGTNAQSNTNTNNNSRSQRNRNTGAGAITRTRSTAARQNQVPNRINVIFDFGPRHLPLPTARAFISRVQEMLERREVTVARDAPLRPDKRLFRIQVDGEFPNDDALIAEVAVEFLKTVHWISTGYIFVSSLVW